LGEVVWSSKYFLLSDENIFSGEWKYFLGGGDDISIVVW